nr:uncharacterized protein LOC132778050 isoform X4 [Anolis sagrei ordinatus]
MQSRTEMTSIMIFFFSACALLPRLVTANEYGGNTGGKSCVFPFAYKSRTFYTCTSEDVATGRLWCATTGSYDKDKQRSYCADTRLVANDHGPCIFPFIYKGKSYSSCTTAGASTGKLWCSLSRNYDTNPRWTYCDPSEPRPCVFPFIFRGKSYSACTPEGTDDGQLWCATTNNYDRDSKWKACSIQEYEGNSVGKVCVFPFIYNGTIYNTCTNKNNSDGQFWCATTGNYDKDKQWSYCADTRLGPNQPCIFPFTYNGKSYWSCIADGESSGKPWCSLTSNYNEDPRRIYCNSSEYGGNTGGNSCVFPFAYKSRTYYTCTSEDVVTGHFWCATTGSYDKDKQRSYCADTRLVANDHGPCIFPFIYKGKSYSSCTTAGASTGKLWCSLSRNYDRNPRWTYCDPSEPRPCVFPFIFRGKSYSACTPEGTDDGQLWCATTNNYDRDSKWKACSIQEYEGNSVGKVCVFPFIYNGTIYNTCTNKNNSDGQFWCATTGNYDKDKQWSYCADTRLGPNQPCIFPFTYNGKSYWSCIADGESSGKPWCSLTSNYNEDPRRIYCNSSEYVGNTGGKSCVFPFAYKSRTFYTCTSEDVATGHFWCATTGSYDKDKQRSYCADTRLVANDHGPCIFPFIYKGKSYSSCTTAGASTGKLWCSLSRNYDRNPRWTYCDPSEPRPCVFPFIFRGKSYSACTPEGTDDGQLWCATTNNYDRDSKWKACSIQEYEGNSVGKVCVFPFIYNGTIYNTCTNKNNSDGQFWCATTGNYDKDKQWSYCADTRLGPNQPCIFPFTYNGKSYWSCIADGESSGKPWCSLTSNYNEDPRRIYCNSSGLGPNQPCIFPFTYNGKSYWSCTADGESSGKLWCSLTSNYNEDPRWIYCNSSVDQNMDLATARLDYCNALYVRLSWKFNILQRAAARWLPRAPYRERSSLLFKELHWLPFIYRTQFKMQVLTDKALNGLGPAYLRDRISVYEPTQSLRSSREDLISIPPASQQQLVGTRERAFSVEAPRFWNSLPKGIRQAPTLAVFGRDLKTWLFQCAFLE